jgi:hypothetical protein
MVEFTRELRTTNGQNLVYVRPRGEVADNDWVYHFITQFSNVPVPEFFMLVDLIGVDDNIGLDGFSRLSNLTKIQGFDRTRIAMLPPNECYDALAKTFNIAAESRDLNFKIKLFRSSDAAEDWLGNQ